MAQPPGQHSERQDNSVSRAGAPAPDSSGVVRAALHARTDKGELELRTRQHGLSPRARQLLLLIDCRRDQKRLARVFPAHELSAYLTLLETEGFIRVERAASDTTPPDRLESLRDRTVKRLIETLGTSGEAFALRVARCRTQGEIEALVPAIASVVEVMSGKDSANRFSRSVFTP